MKKFLCIALLSITVNLCAMEQPEQKFTHNTYNGVPITADNILELTPDMPHDMLPHAKEWIEKHATKVKQWTKTPQLTSHIWAITRHYLNQLDALAHYKNRSKGSNLALDIDNNTIIKISSLTNRLYTLYKLTTDKDPCWDSEKKTDRYFKDFPIQQMTSSGKPTFQHISILAHYLRLKEKNLHNIKTVDSYPLHIPGQPTKAADENYVIVQPKYGKNIIELRDLPLEEQTAIINNLSPETLAELHEAIKYAALWDVGNNIMVNRNHTNELWYGDLEQPNNSGTFFYQGEEGLKKFNHDVSVGLKAIGKKLEPISKNKFEQWQALSKKN